jgi:L-arabinonolactonase
MSTTLWAATTDGQIANYSSATGTWKTYDYSTTSIFADPKNASSLYYTNADGQVVLLDVETNKSTVYPTTVSGGNPGTPPMKAKMISVGGQNTLWVIDSNGTWARYSTGTKSWDPYTGQQTFIFAGSVAPGACYYIDENAAVNWRNVNDNKNMTYPGLLATAVTANRCNPPYAIGEDGTLNSWDEEASSWINYPSVACQSIFADPKNACRCYFVTPSGAVCLYCTSAKSVIQEFPNIVATQISAGDLCNQG